MAATRPEALQKQPRPQLEDPGAPSLLAIGFRPFFLLATLIAICWVPLWLLVLGGSPNANHVFAGHRFPATALHAHEMIFGFAVAVIAGFLLTAGANWAGRPTTSGPSLALLVALYLAGRVCMLTSSLSPLTSAAVDMAFLPALALTLILPLVRARSFRNFQFVGMLTLLWIANGLMHVGALSEFVSLPGITWQTGSTLALRVITFMILVMGGRVIPLFTKNVTGIEIARRPQVERLALAGFIVAALVDLFLEISALTGSLFLFTGLLHLWRMKTWGTQSAKVPLLWILHAGYAAVALSFILEGLADWGFLSPTLALHLLTIGGIGGLCLGMMTRVTLGHSGRKLTAPRQMTVAFYLLLGAALVRVTGPLFGSSWLGASYQFSGVLWTAAFLLLLHFGVPIWFSPRADHPPRNDK